MVLQNLRAALGIVLLSVVSLAPPAAGQEGTPDLAEMEAALEEAFAAALAIGIDDPTAAIPAWQVVVTQAVSLSGARRLTETGEGHTAETVAAAVESILQRWREARPRSGGPDLFRVLWRARLTGEPEEMRAAILDLLPRYPDDPMVVSTVTSELRRAGEGERATEILEAFADRRPLLASAHAMLVQDAGRDATRRVEALRDWNAALPGHPALVSAWFDSELPRTDPRATRLLAEDLFRADPSGDAGLDACIAVLEGSGPELSAPARACIVRIAADPATPEDTARRAVSKLVEIATLFLRLLAEADEGSVFPVVSHWTRRSLSGWRGDLPDGTLEVLERRLESAAERKSLYRALDVAYQVEGETERRFEMLARWQRTDPSSFPYQRTVELAEHLVAEGEADAAVVMLERERDGFAVFPVLEVLWSLYRSTESDARAEVLARELIEDDLPTCRAAPEP